MTPDTVAAQQVYAAWTQAIGSVAGIFASIWIAVSANRRADRAVQAAADREKAAAAAGLEREIAAERRAMNAMTSSVNQAIEIALTAVPELRTLIEAEVVRIENQITRGYDSVDRLMLPSERFAYGRAIVDRLVGSQVDPNLIAALTALSEALRPATGDMQHEKAALATARARLQELDEAADQVQGMRSLQVTSH